MTPRPHQDFEAEAIAALRSDVVAAKPQVRDRVRGRLFDSVVSSGRSKEVPSSFEGSAPVPRTSHSQVRSSLALAPLRARLRNAVIGTPVALAVAFAIGGGAGAAVAVCSMHKRPSEPQIVYVERPMTTPVAAATRARKPAKHRPASAAAQQLDVEAQQLDVEAQQPEVDGDEEVAAHEAERSASTGEVAAGTGQVAADMSQVAAGTGSVASDMSQVAAGTGQVAAGMSQVAAGTGQVAAGMSQVAAVPIQADADAVGGHRTESQRPGEMRAFAARALRVPSHPDSGSSLVERTSLPQPAAVSGSTPIPKVTLSQAVPNVAPDVAGALAAQQALLDEARRSFARRDYQATLRQLESHVQQFPNSVLLEEREALAIKALAAMGHGEDAKRRGAIFLARFPRSLLRSSVNDTMNSIR